MPQRDACANRGPHAGTHRDANTRADRDANAQAHRDANAQAHRDANAQDPPRRQRAHRGPPAHRDANAQAHRDANAQAHRDAVPETEVPAFTDEDYTTGSITAQEENAFLLLNQDRAANGRSALELDPALCDLARLKSRDMFLNNYFSHTSPTYGSAAQMLSAYGYAFTSVGENIAHHATVEKAQAAFMSSSGHRQNILGSQWTKVGIGVWEDSQGFVYVTQLFVR